MDFPCSELNAADRNLLAPVLYRPITAINLLSLDSYLMTSTHASSTSVEVSVGASACLRLRILLGHLVGDIEK